MTADFALISFLEKGTISQPNIALIFSNLGNLDGSFSLSKTPALSPANSLKSSLEKPILSSTHTSAADVLHHKKKGTETDLRRSVSLPNSPAVPRANKVDVSLRTSSIAIPLFDHSEQDIVSRARVFGAATAGKYKLLPPQCCVLTDPVFSGGTTEFLASCFTLNGQLHLSATFNSVAHTREACDQLMHRVIELLKSSL